MMVQTTRLREEVILCMHAWLLSRFIMCYIAVECKPASYITLLSQKSSFAICLFPQYLSEMYICTSQSCSPYPQRRSTSWVYAE